MKQTVPLFAFMLLFSSATPALGMSISVQVLSETCLGNDGGAWATVTGGVEPCTYDWSNGATGNPVTGMAQGSYSLTVTDQLGATATHTFDVGPVPDLNDLYQDLATTEGLEPCPFQCNGGFRLHLPRVQGGYVLSTSPSSIYNELPEDEPSGHDYYITYEFLGPFCENADVTLTIALGNGCSGGVSTIPIGVPLVPGAVVQDVTGSCTDGNDGTVTAQITVPVAPAWFDAGVDDGQGTIIPGGGYSGGTFTAQFMGLHPGDWTLVLVSNDEASFQTPCTHTFPFTVPDLGPDCGTLSGTVHFETDVDCVQDGGEFGIPYRMLRVEPGPLYGITGPDGSYAIGVPYGASTVEQLDPAAVQLCPPEAPVPFAVSGGTPNAVVILADSLLTPFDLSAHLWNSIARPGQVFEYLVDVYNQNGHPGDALTITLEYDPLFMYASATPGLAQNGAGQAVWTLPSLAPFEHRHLSLGLLVPPDPQLIGTEHSALLSVTSATAEQDLSDNNSTRMITVQGPYDPNTKEAYTSSGTAPGWYFIDLDQHIDYLVRFQNTGTDTAFNVVVTDTISPLLDLSTLEISGSSHDPIPSIRPGRELRFAFNDIQLPDSNTNEAASHGYVAFRLSPIAGIGMDEVIGNAVDIYFDFNPPVRTDTATLITTISVGVETRTVDRMGLSPVPVIDRLRISGRDGQLRWIDILAADGRVVRSQRAAPVLDLSGLGAGVYLLMAQRLDGTMELARFVKQ